jgi:hypothetical protein
MVTDIVERLRSIEDEHDLLDSADLIEEAANEIERLREFKGVKAVANMLCPPVPKSIDPTGW